MGLFGSILGVLFGMLLLYLIKTNFADKLPAYMTYEVRLSAIGQGLGAGALISFLFSVVPLLRIRHIKPNELLREDSGAVEPRRVDLIRWIAAALVLLVRWAAGGRSHEVLPPPAGPAGPPPVGSFDQAQRILDERFARGEIDVEEYRLRRDTLRGG